MTIQDARIELVKVSEELRSIIYPVVDYKNNQAEMMKQVIENTIEKAAILRNVVDDIVQRISEE